MNRGFLIAAAAAALVCGRAEAAPRELVFSGLSGASTMKDVKAQFPKAVVGNNCRTGETVRTYADGPSRCDHLELDGYELAGYSFEVMFVFYPSGGLKTLHLRWPKIETSKGTSDQQITNAYFVMLDQLAAKYGPKARKAPCEILGRICAVWQMSGETEYSIGGERIELEAETKSLRGLTISYRFADRGAFNRF